MNQKGIVHLLVPIILLIGIIGGVWLVTSGPLKLFPKASQDQDISQAAKEAQTLTLQLAQTTNRAGDQLQTQNISSLQQIADERKEIMMKVAKENPDEFLKYAFPKSIREKLPEAVASLIEKEEKISGILEIIHKDNFNNKKSETEYILERNDERIFLYSPKEFPKLTSNSRIEVEGVKLEEVMVVNKIQDIGVGALGGPGNETFGEQKVVIINTSFDNTQTQTTNEQLKQIVFDGQNSSNAYYKEVSYNQVSLVGDVFGPYTIPEPTQFCDDYKIFNDAIESSDNEVNFRNYTRVIIVFPHTSACWSDAWADIGYSSFSSDDGLIIASKSWINGLGRSDIQGVFTHELGHNFGVGHANLYNCHPRIIDGRCTSQEYQDHFDVMGQNSGHFNAPHKEYVQWLGGSNVLEVTSDGEYSLEPIEVSGSGIKMLKVPKELSANNIVRKWYYLEYRQPIGFDTLLQGENLFNGLLVHYNEAKEPSIRTLLLHMNPVAEQFGWNNFALKTGNRYTDSATGTSFMPTGKTPTGIRVDVKTPSQTCIHANPTIDIYPRTQDGTSGQTLDYQIYITNNDNSFCNNSRFSLNFTSASPGWSGTFTDSQLDLPTDGTTSTTLHVQSSNPAVIGYHSFTVSVQNSTDATLNDSLDATYFVLNSNPSPPPSPIPPSPFPSPCTNTCPSIFASPDPVLPGPGLSLGTTTITWDTGDDSVGQVYVSYEQEPEKLFAQGAKGSQDAPWIQYEYTYTFKLYKGTSHSQLLGSAVVTRTPLPGAYVAASPNPVPTTGASTCPDSPQANCGLTNITWNLGHGSDAQVYVSMDGAEEVLFSQGPSGSQEASWIQTGHSYVFKLYQETSKYQLIDSVTVTR